MKQIIFFIFIALSFIFNFCSQPSSKIEQTLISSLKTIDSLKSDLNTTIPIDTLNHLVQHFNNTMDNIRRYNVFLHGKKQFLISQFVNHNEFLESAIIKHRQLNASLQFSNTQIKNLLLDLQEHNISEDSIKMYTTSELVILNNIRQSIENFKNEYYESRKDINNLTPSIQQIIDSLKHSSH